MIASLVLALASQDVAQEVVRFELAPELAVERWIGTPVALEESAAATLFVVPIQWPGDADVIAFFEDLARANVDGGAVTLFLAPSETPRGEDPEELVRALGIESALGLVAEPATQPYYAALARHSAGCVLVGRGGGVLWFGDALGAPADFSANVREALWQQPPLEHPGFRPRPELREAARSYFGARLSASLRLAEELRASTEDEELDSQALRLVARIDATRAVWLENARSAAATRDARTFLRFGGWLGRAFKERELQAEVRQLEKELRREVPEALRETRQWTDLHFLRPALFPARRSERGDSFVEKLTAFAERAGEDSLLGAEARALVARYAEAQ